MERPKLDQADLQSALWLKLQTFYSARLEELRRKNDGAMSPEDTTRLRGRIGEIKAFLDLPKERGEPEPEA